MKYKITLWVFLIGFICFACGEVNNKQETNLPPNKLGAKVYKKYCISCHGLDGKAKTNGALDITVSKMQMDERILLINNGRGLMTPFKGILKKKEIKAVAEYTFTL